MTCYVEEIKYGNVVLSAVIVEKSAKMDPKYNAAKAITHSEITIDFDMIIDLENSYVDSNGFFAVDEKVQDIKDGLMKQGQLLEFDYVGFGLDVTQVFASLGQKDLKNNDISYGPNPQVLEWTPIASNRAVSIKWRVVLNILPCVMTGDFDQDIYDRYSTSARKDYFTDTAREDGDLDKLKNSYVITSFTAKTTTVITNEGRNSTVIEGEIRVIPDSTKGEYYFYNFLLAHLFVGMGHELDKTNYSITINEDGASASFSLKIDSVNSLNVYFPYLAECSVKHKVGSQLLSGGDSAGAVGGFTKWLNTLSCNFTVEKGTWPGWAWVAFKTILANRRRVPLQENVALVDEDEAEEKGELTERQYLLALDIEEDIYENSVAITATWMLVTSFQRLLTNTQLFKHVDWQWDGEGQTFDPKKPVARIPENMQTATQIDIAEQGKTRFAAVYGNALGGDNVHLDKGSAYLGISKKLNNMALSVKDRNSNCSHQNASDNTLPDYSSYIEPTSGSVQRLNFTGSEMFDDTFLIDPYDPEIYDATEVFGHQDGVGSPTTMFSDTVTKEKSWLAFDNSFIIEEDSTGIVIPTIERIHPGNLQEVRPELERTRSNFTIANRTSPMTEYPGGPDINYSSDQINIRNKPIFKLVMKGYAYRAKYQIPMPVVQSVGGKPVFRTGKNNWLHKPIATSDQFPMYMAAWNVTYYVQGDPAGQEIIIGASDARNYA